MTKVRKKIGTIPFNEIQQKANAATEQIKQDISDFIDEETAQYPEIGGVFKFQEDPEGRMEVSTDADERILSYRKPDGTLVENVGLETPSVTADAITLSSEGMNKFEKALKDDGFNPGGMGDFSDKEVVELPEPRRYGIINLKIPSLPLNDADVSEGYVEYYDFGGNYFKKSCEITAQGQTSRIFARTGGKGNYTLDITDDSEIKFGNWVPQDSFHLKGCAKDVTRSYLPTSYKLAYKVMEALDAKPNRVLMDEDSITSTQATGDRTTDWPMDARCLPDGFPVELYFNGEYWGLYSFQLKKHRKNYSMKKSDYTSFFLDADKIMEDGYTTGIWDKGPDNYWGSFEIKNPKDLVCMDGSKYDGDNPKELIDDTSEYYDSSNKAHKGSAQTKALIKSFSTRYNEVKALIDSGDTESAKAKFNEYFDYNACMLVYIFNCTMRNNDSVKKNTLWGIYKGGKIAPMLWDLDGMYGEGWVGQVANNPNSSTWTTYAKAAWPLGLMWSLYKDEIKATYRDLRKSGVLSIDTWHDIVFGWNKRVGEAAYNRDIEKWPETPSYRKNNINTEYWSLSNITEVLGSDSIWNAEKQYNIGDTAAILHSTASPYYAKFRAIKANINIPPANIYYKNFPIVGGYFNSPKRMEKWMQEQFNLCDRYVGYSE